MDLNRLTNRAREALMGAHTIASRYRHQQIEPEHLLLAMLQQEEGLASRLVAKVGASPDRIIESLEKQLAQKPKVYTSPGGQEQVYLSPSISRLLEKAGTKPNPLRMNI